MTDRTLRPRAARQPPSGAARATLLAAAAALVALGLWWIGRASPQAYAPPTDGGRAFSGVAAGYEGPGARLLLVQGGQTGDTVGRLEADGRFHFVLPGQVPTPRLTRAMALQLDYMGDAGGATNEANRARIAAWPATPESAVHGLQAGDGWVGLSVEPLEMNVVRQAIAYLGDDGRYGDLVVAKGEPGRVALAGDAMLVFVYADRPGRVRGKASTVNAFGQPVLHDWDLRLQAGWNVVTSEQAPDLSSLAYRSGPVPAGFEWWVLPAR